MPVFSISINWKSLFDLESPDLTIWTVSTFIISKFKRGMRLVPWGNTRRDLPSSKSKSCRRTIRRTGLQGPGLTLSHCAQCPHLLPLSVVLKYLVGGQNFRRNSTMFYCRLTHRSLDGKSYLRTRLKLLLLWQWNLFQNRARPQQSYDTSRVCVYGGGGGGKAYSQFHFASPDLCPYIRSPLSSISHRHVSWIIFPEESFD